MSDYNARFMSAAELANLPLRACGENVLLDSSVKLIGLENIVLGNDVRIDAGTIIIATGPVTIGSWVHIAANCYLEGRGGITIRDFANVSSYVSLHSVSDDFSGASLTNPMTPERYKRLNIGEIVLDRHALLGTKSTVLPGVRVGEGGVLGAHSMARGDIAPFAIHAGVPARKIKDRGRDLLELERKFRSETGA